MLKTTAKVEHRDFVPFGWLAFEFCNVNFYGYRAKEMEKAWEDIRHQRYLKYDSLFKENEIKIQDLRSRVNAIRSKVMESKPFYRLWYNKAEKQKLCVAKKLSDKADELEEKNKKVSQNRFYSVYESHRKIEKLLQDNGFVLTSTSSSGDECVRKVEIWTLEE